MGRAAGSGRSRSTSRAHGTTASISAKNLSRRVCLFLPAYSACKKLPCRSIGPPPTPTNQPILPDASGEKTPYFSVSLRNGRSM